MKNSIAIPLTGILIFLAAETMAQKINNLVEFGKIDKKDLAMTAYEADTTTSAVILFDYAVNKLTFAYTSFARHRRIKIFKKDGYEWGNDMIPLIEIGASERIKTLKAATYNLVDGQVKQSLLDETGQFKEQFNDNIKLIRFAMPDVREGCVIDIYYELENVGLVSWTFQNTIPTILSDYTFITEVGFSYIIQGYLRPKVKEGHSFLYGRECRSLQLTMNDVPAFKSEPNISTVQDYISRARFHMTPFSAKIDEFQTVGWYSAVTQWSDVPGFYQRLQFAEDIRNVKNSAFLGAITAGVIQNCQTQKEKIEAIHQHVRNHINWNHINTIVAPNIQKAYSNKKGSAADINLTLLAMLRHAGLMAEPVLISTKENGMMRPDLPTITQFNRVIVQSNLDGKNVFLDATEKYLPYNYLPLSSAVMLGYVAAESHPGFIGLANLSNTATTITTTIDIATDGTLTGTLTVEKNGYEAAASRKRYKELGEKEYLENVYRSSGDIHLSTPSFSNTESLTGNFIESYSLKTSAENTGNFDVLYLNPIPMERVDENPFRETERRFPVDLNFPKTTTYMTKIKVPSGYSVDELPSPKLGILPEGAAKFVYNATHSRNEITLICQVAVNRSHFTAVEYPDLREFINIALAKQAEQIVLKKIK